MFANHRVIWCKAVDNRMMMMLMVLMAFCDLFSLLDPSQIGYY